MAAVSECMVQMATSQVSGAKPSFIHMALKIAPYTAALEVVSINVTNLTIRCCTLVSHLQLQRLNFVCAADQAEEVLEVGEEVVTQVRVIVTTYRAL